MELKNFILQNWASILFGLAWAIPPYVFFWNLFNSANEKGWYSLIPIYNIIILLKIVNIRWFFILIYLPQVIFMSDLISNPILSLLSILISIIFSFYLYYRALIFIGKKPYDLMGFLFDMTILSPIFFLVHSNEIEYENPRK